MATEFWGIKEGKLVHRLNVQKGDEVLCPGCGKPLTVVQWDGKDTSSHFRCYTSKCSGGAPETILHRMVKDFFVGVTEYDIPAWNAVLPQKQGGVYRGAEVEVVKGEKFHVDEVLVEPHGLPVPVKSAPGGVAKLSVIPDVVLVQYGTDSADSRYVFIEIVNTHSISEEKLRAYREIDEARVVAVDIPKYRSKINSDDCSWVDAYRDAVLHEGRLMYSLAVQAIKKNLKSAVYRASGNDWMLCPAEKGEHIVRRAVNCDKCPFCLSRKGTAVECLGKGAYASKAQLLGSLTREERLDGVCLPEEVGRVKVSDEAPLEGVCPRCGRPTVFAQNSGIAGIARVDELTGDDAGKYCVSCGKVWEIKCPSCKKHNMILRRSGKGKVFLKCPNRDGETGCGTSLTLFSGYPCTAENYGDELIAVGGIDAFLNSFSTSFKKVEELRERFR